MDLFREYAEKCGAKTAEDYYEVRAAEIVILANKL